MASIVIKELDNTTGGTSAVETDVVYVPGFSSEEFDDPALAAPARTPMLCTSIREFERYFGKRPASLKEAEDSDIKYSDITSEYEATDNAGASWQGPNVVVSKTFGSDVQLVPDVAATINVHYTAGNSIIEKTATVEIDNRTFIKNISLTDKYSESFVGTGSKKNYVLTYGGISDITTTITINGVATTDYTYSMDSNTITFTTAPSKDSTIVVEYLLRPTDIVATVTYTIQGSSTDSDAIAFKRGAKDLSYIYAKELISLGIPVMYESMNTYGGTQASILDMYSALSNDVYSELKDRGEYNIKYLTSGGYPAFEMFGNTVATKMVDTANNRGDCVAIVDPMNEPDRKLEGEDSVYKKAVAWAKGLGVAISDKVAMFYPWANFTPVTLSKDDYSTYVTLPPSYCYLSALAVSLRTNASWMAVAGATRGSIPNLYYEKPMNMNKRITNALAEQEYQNRDGVSINAITNIKPYGYRIWGNRTLKDNSIEGNLTATSFLNIRNMVSEIKKVSYVACKKLMFEQNNDILWNNFKSAIEPTLDRMKTGQGLSGYKVIKGTTDEKAKLVATIKLYPVYAVEDFEITVVMEDDEISMS